MDQKSKRTRLAHFLVLATLLFATPIQGQDVTNFSEGISHFYLHPTKKRYDMLQQQADKYAGVLQSKENGADLLAAAWIARVSEKYHWQITGKSDIATKAREIAGGRSQTAKYVRDDSNVDPTKLDIWWTSFFATGDTGYLEKILQRAEELRNGQRAFEMLVPAAATWSFKANCKQHPAVLAYAKECLKTNKFPKKKKFLQECVNYSEKP